MSSRRYAAPLVIEPERDHALEIAVAVVHLLAGLTCWLLPWPKTLAFGATMLIAVGFLWSWGSRLHPRGRRRIRRVVWDAEGCWWLDVGARTRVACRLQGEGLALPWCVVLNFAGRGLCPHALVLREGMVDAHTLRRLRARLNIEDLAAASSNR